MLMRRLFTRDSELQISNTHRRVMYPTAIGNSSTRSCPRLCGQRWNSTGGSTGWRETETGLDQNVVRFTSIVELNLSTRLLLKVCLGAGIALLDVFLGLFAYTECPSADQLTHIRADLFTSCRAIDLDAASLPILEFRTLPWIAVKRLIVSLALSIFISRQ